MSKLGLSVTYDLGDAITAIDISNDYYVAGLLDESVHVFEGSVSKENEPIRLEGHQLGIIDLKLHQHLLAVSSLDSVIRVWDLKAKVIIKEIQCDQMENWKLCWHGELLCTAGEGGRVSIYDITNQNEIEQFSIENSFATCLASDGRSLAVCTDSGSLHIVEGVLEKHKLHQISQLHKKIIRSVCFTNDGLKTFTASDDGEIKLVDLQKMKTIKTFITQPILALDLNPIDEKLFVTCNSDYTVKLWDTITGQCTDSFQPFDRKDDRLWSVRFNPDGTQIAVCSQQGQLSFYSRI